MVDTGLAGKPTLLLTRDSFSNALTPFLLGHFSRVVLTHIDDGFWRQDLIDRFHPDLVMLEVQEHGLGFSMRGAPSVSEAAERRIEAVLPKAPTHGPLARSAPSRGRFKALGRTDRAGLTLRSPRRAAPSIRPCSMSGAWRWRAGFLIFRTGTLPRGRRAPHERGGRLCPAARDGPGPPRRRGLLQADSRPAPGLHAHAQRHRPAARNL
uniref:Uncharacterized protein n=1 Tax=Phenylobacterium glaciei TaxID=2803784 RepID=A0A974SAA5_9CAUL|nr:hypothetical protein JKL49_02210 [Phenylobacterium glaciei]